MKKSKAVMGIALAALWMAAGIAALVAPAKAQDEQHQTMTGVVSNTHCGLKHSKANAAEGACVNMCVKDNNASYALVSGGKLYKLDGLTPELTKLAGQNVKVTGHLAGSTMQVEKVELSK